MPKFALAAVLFLAGVQGLMAQNSTKKIRTPPGEAAAKVGSAIAWQPDVATALAKAKAAHKPVFWYVPTVARSPMDRTKEIDRYLRGGPFSWPSTIDLLASGFVCVDEVPRGELQKKYDLVRQKFLEPGYLVLDTDGAVLAKVDQLTTFQPEWFEAPLLRRLGRKADGFPCSAALREAWDAYRQGDLAAARTRAAAVLAKQPAPAVAAEARWLTGAALFRGGEPRKARECWQLLADDMPEQPLAWKAALEAEELGPFVHGFEDYLPVPAALLQQDPVDGTRALPGVYDEPELWRRSVAFLLAMDDGEGVLRDSIYDFGGTDGLPNVYAAVTCLAGMALLAAEDRCAAGTLVLDPGTRARIGKRIERLQVLIDEEAWLSLSDRDEIVWSRAYAVRFLAALAQRRPQQRDALLPTLAKSVGALLGLQPETGVWFHEYGNPFASATALQALAEAKALGCEVDQTRIDRGLAALLQDRTKEGSFTYGHTARGEPRESIEAGAGRMPLCEHALFAWGRSDADKLLAACEHGQRHHGFLAAVRKYDDHADRLHYGGFFFWFDVLGRAEATAKLPAGDARARLVAAQHAMVLALPEFDGCFVDSHELGRCYGTAMALLCLDVLGRAEAAR